MQTLGYAPFYYVLRPGKKPSENNGITPAVIASLSPGGVVWDSLVLGLLIRRQKGA